MAKRQPARRNAPKVEKGSDVQAAIAEAGLEWYAADAPSVLPGLGLRVDEAEKQEIQAAISAANSVERIARSFAAPSSVDWRNNSGNWLTPIRNQGACGSCVSFACCATIESRIKIVCRNAGLDTDLSEAHLFFCGCGNCCDSGWNFTPALDFCKNTGVGLESDFPYTDSNQPCRNISSHVTLSSWRRILSVNERKSSLASKGPVVGGLAIYSDFYNYSSGVYRRTPGANLEGYHAVCVVGYDDGQDCWICKNSWGPGWGDSGYFRIGYGEAEMDTDFAFYEVELECPAPAPQPDECQNYVPFLQRVLTVARTDWRLRACLRYYICRRGYRPYCGSREIQIVRYVYQILQRCPQYRDPFCRLLG